MFAPAKLGWHGDQGVAWGVVGRGEGRQGEGAQQEFMGALWGEGAARSWQLCQILALIPVSLRQSWAAQICATD